MCSLRPPAAFVYPSAAYSDRKRKPGLKSKIRRPLQQLARRDLAGNPSSRRPSRVDALRGGKRYGEAFSQQNKAGRTGEMQRLRLIGCFRRELSKPDGVVSSTNGRDNQMRFVSVALCLTSLAIFVPGSVTAQNTNPVDKPEFKHRPHAHSRNERSKTASRLDRSNYYRRRRRAGLKSAGAVPARDAGCAGRFFEDHHGS